MTFFLYLTTVRCFYDIFNDSLYYDIFYALLNFVIFYVLLYCPILLYYYVLYASLYNDVLCLTI